MPLRSLFGLYLPRWCSGDSPHLRQREPREIQGISGTPAAEVETNQGEDCPLIGKQRPKILPVPTSRPLCARHHVEMRGN